MNIVIGVLDMHLPQLVIGYLSKEETGQKPVRYFAICASEVAEFPEVGLWDSEGW